MAAITVNDQTFQTTVLDNSKPVLVDFWAPWCGPCRSMSSVVDELADEVGTDAVVVKVNVDEAAATAAEYNVSSIPTFAVIQNGQVRERLGGVVSKETLRQALAV